MKLLIILFMISLTATAQDFEDCSLEVVPAVCVGKKLAEKIDDLGGINERGPVQLKPGIYRYYKGHDQVDTGLRKIEVRRNPSKQIEITYYGANGGILTYFTCERDSLVCNSPNRHMLILMKSNSFFIDWADDSNGTYQLTKN